MRKGDLSPARRWLLEQCQKLGFGRIEHILVAGGEPILSQKPRMIRDVVFGKANGPRPEADLDDFGLKTHAVELFQYLDMMDDGVIDVLVVKHGLPFQMQVAVRT